MAYAERFIIAAILFTSAYDIYTGASNTFYYRLLGQLSDFIRGVQDDYIVDLCRKGLAIFIGSGGLVLLFNILMELAIISQIVLVILSFFDDTHGTILNTLQWVIFNLVILIFLVLSYLNKDQ